MSLAQNWTLDFEERKIFGSVVQKMHILVDKTEFAHFDSNSLLIESVHINGSKAVFVESASDPALGTRIVVTIPKENQAVGSEFDILFGYSTSPDASALQWLEPSATKGGQHPYVFTQCQAIHARSLLPCLDSPGVKSTFSATVEAPSWCTGKHPTYLFWMFLDCHM